MCVCVCVQGGQAQQQVYVDTIKRHEVDRVLNNQNDIIQHIRDLRSAPVILGTCCARQTFPFLFYFLVVFCDGLGPFLRSGGGGGWVEQGGSRSCTLIMNQLHVWSDHC